MGDPCLVYAELGAKNHKWEDCIFLKAHVAQQEAAKAKGNRKSLPHTESHVAEVAMEEDSCPKIIRWGRWSLRLKLLQRVSIIMLPTAVLRSVAKPLTHLYITWTLLLMSRESQQSSPRLSLRMFQR